MNRLNELNVGDRVWMVPSDTRYKPFPAEVVKKGRKLITFMKVFPARMGREESIGGYFIEADMTITHHAIPIARANFGSGYGVFKDKAEHLSYVNASAMRHVICRELTFGNRHSPELIMKIAALMGLDGENKDEC